MSYIAVYCTHRATGLGTFMPMHTEKVDEHKMHAETVELEQATIDLIQAKRHIPIVPA